MPLVSGMGRVASLEPGPDRRGCTVAGDGVDCRSRHRNALFDPLSFRRRHRRWIVLVALFSLLFQQFALARHLCAFEMAVPVQHEALADEHACCHPTASIATDETLLCAQHCSAVTPAPDHPPAPGVPVLLPPTSWILPLAARLDVPCGHDQLELRARATAPPLNIRDCSFQI
ncbi:hypothetical protein [Dokdonella sp.]|uniref:hypothetical protein n=1 Tax=Dokdonella sp. TaxID=2291710 RepID=UPI0025B9172C|nr:hypothetical protein [Dokdonella sp.]MBX3688920.1 hypothetical protein [Dokdonella sp.]